MSIRENLVAVEERLEKAAFKAGVKRSDIELVSVTKTVPCERIQEALQAGYSVFGENRVQEFMQKHEYFEKNAEIDWHLIGQLQTNKVKYIVNRVSLVHSLDRIQLAQEIDRCCKAHNTSMDCLIEVNVAKEESKAGVYEEDLDKLIEEIQPLEHVRIKGIMTIAPYFEDAENARIYFARAKRIFDRLSNIKTDRFEMKYLSMGMSGDFEQAIVEGANVVRIGSAIFGDRI